MSEILKKQIEFMQIAVALSLEGMRGGFGGPFGAIVVREGVIVGRGYNKVLATNDPTAHAEIVAIRDACSHLKTFQLEGCEIYTSCEPCPMCLSAIYWSRAERIFFGNTQSDAAAIGFDDSFLYEEVKKGIHERKIPSQQLGFDLAKSAFEEWALKADKINY